MATNNYQLKNGSCDRRRHEPEVVNDINGLARPQRTVYDLGCYEMP